MLRRERPSKGLHGGFGECSGSGRLVSEPRRSAASSVEPRRRKTTHAPGHSGPGIVMTMLGRPAALAPPTWRARCRVENSETADEAPLIGLAGAKSTTIPSDDPIGDHEHIETPVFYRGSCCDVLSPTS
jgi:hypothetical protein